jgi:hypothetical protein
LAAQVKGVAIPVYFKVYEHKGVLSENERINFIRKAFSLMDLKEKLLIADSIFRNGLQSISNQIVNWLDFDKYLRFIL